MGIMKPDIVFFGEGLPEAFHKQLQEDKTEVIIVRGREGNNVRGRERDMHNDIHYCVWVG